MGHVGRGGHRSNVCGGGTVVIQRLGVFEEVEITKGAYGAASKS